MCECGCTSNDERYWFPAPGSCVYLLTITRGCVDCDAAAGVSIELITKSDFRKYHREFVDGELKFEDWSDSRGVAIVTGFRKHEFVKAMLPNFVGTELTMFEGGVIDEVSAEVLLEEAYEDSVVRPHFPTKKDVA